MGSDQVTEPWLDEALAEYSGYLYYERMLPDDTLWWWSYAVDQWAPTGKIDYLIYEFRDNRGYSDAVYRRGAEFIRDLRQVMSDPAFFGFLMEYQRRHAYRLATSREFSLWRASSLRPTSCLFRRSTSANVCCRNTLLEPSVFHELW